MKSESDIQLPENGWTFVVCILLKAVKILFAVILLVFLIYNNSILQWLLVNGAQKGLFFPFLWGWMFLAFIYALIFTWLHKNGSERKKVISLFLFAVLPRGFVCAFNLYEPTSDFRNYLLYGQYVFSGNYQAVAEIISRYQMPKMGGIAVFNGLLARVFSPLLIGMQISNIVMTSLICVLIYLLLRPTHTGAALSAGVLYALYPSNIISTQITTNHHGATLLFLAAILFYRAALDSGMSRKGFLFLSASVFFTAASNFIHPSVVIVLLSLMSYSILFAISKNSADYQSSIAKKIEIAPYSFHKNSKLSAFKKYTICKAKVFKTLEKPKFFALVCMVILLCGYQVLTFAGLQIFSATGLVENLDEITPLFKIVVGLNQDTGGTVRNNPDTEYIMRYPPEEQARVCLQMIRIRLRDPRGITALVFEKTNSAWFTRDSYFSWYTEARRSQYTQLEEAGLLTPDASDSRDLLLSVQSGLEHLDVVFVQILYLLTIAELLLNKSWRTNSDKTIFLFIAVGWMIVIAVTEMQPRYRYPAMPSFCMLASMGAIQLKNHCRLFLNIVKRGRNQL